MKRILCLHRVRPIGFLRFGDACLLRRGRGACELRGGSRADQQAAREWLSLFQQDAVLLPGPGNELVS
jgi:hypothetical protein